MGGKQKREVNLKKKSSHRHKSPETGSSSGKREALGNTIQERTENLGTLETAFGAVTCFTGSPKGHEQHIMQLW